MKSSRMPRKSTQTWLYWWPNSGAKRTSSLAFLVAPMLRQARRPGLPAVRPHRVRRRAERQDVDQHRLAVADPVVAADGPSPGVQPSAIVGGRACAPAPVDAARRSRRRGRGSRASLGPVEIALGEQHAAEQQRRVDRRQLGRLEARAALHVEEVVEEALVAGHARRRVALRRIGQEAQRRERPLRPRPARVTKPRSTPIG